MVQFLLHTVRSRNYTSDATIVTYIVRAILLYLQTFTCHERLPVMSIVTNESGVIYIVIYIYIRTIKRYNLIYDIAYSRKKQMLRANNGNVSV